MIKRANKKAFKAITAQVRKVLTIAPNLAIIVVASPQPENGVSSIIPC